MDTEDIHDAPISSLALPRSTRLVIWHKVSAHTPSGVERASLLESESTILFTVMEDLSHLSPHQPYKPLEQSCHTGCFALMRTGQEDVLRAAETLSPSKTLPILIVRDPLDDGSTASHDPVYQTAMLFSCGILRHSQDVLYLFFD